jgi:hypothetical protein
MYLWCAAGVWKIRDLSTTYDATAQQCGPFEARWSQNIFGATGDIVVDEL